MPETSPDPAVDLDLPPAGSEEFDLSFFDDALLPPANDLSSDCALDHRIADADIPPAKEHEGEWVGFSNLGVRGHGLGGRNVVEWSRRSAQKAAQKCMSACDAWDDNCVACQCPTEPFSFGTLSFWFCWLKEPFPPPAEGESHCGELVDVDEHAIYFKSSYVEEPCGDGRVTGTEECDDGNAVAGDGCSFDCTLEDGFHCPRSGLSCSRPCLGTSETVWSSGVSVAPAIEILAPHAIATVFQASRPFSLEAISAQLLGDTCAAAVELVQLLDSGTPAGTVVQAAAVVPGDLPNAADTPDPTWRMELTAPLSLVHGTRLGLRMLPTAGSCAWSAGASNLLNEAYRRSGPVWGPLPGVEGRTLVLHGVPTGCNGSAICTAPEHTRICSCPAGQDYEDGCVDVAGNGIITGAELCDDGNLVDGDGCDGNGTPSACGNGVQAPDEGCDDGNTIDGDGCDSDCRVPRCGDRTIAPSETCDDGNTVDADGCDSNCRPSGCGNGVRAPDEGCDDGNQIDNDGCDSNCQPTGCGNGHITGDEVCDDGNLVDNDGCDHNCQPTGCGNEVVTGPEECDDGNLIDGHPGSVEADCGDYCEPDTCDSNCTITACGNGIVSADEACDDGNDIDRDACDTACTLGEIGDGVVSHTEECDDGNAIDGDGCSSAGVVTPGWFCGEAGAACVRNAGCFPEERVLAQTVHDFEENKASAAFSLYREGQRFDMRFKTDVEITGIDVRPTHALPALDRSGQELCQRMTVTLLTRFTYLANARLYSSQIGSWNPGSIHRIEVNPHFRHRRQFLAGETVTLSVSGEDSCLLTHGSKLSQFASFVQASGPPSPWVPGIRIYGMPLPCVDQVCIADDETAFHCE